MHHLIQKNSIKICGLSTRSAVVTALEAGADMLGFVFFNRSPRHISLAQARELDLAVEGRALKVALTVDASLSEIFQYIAALQPDLLQLHGHETPEYLMHIKQETGLPIIKAIGVRAMNDIARAAAYACVADYLLFDASPPKDSSLPGGNGVLFDWSLLKAYIDPPIRAPLPWLLSGGLTPETVNQAIAYIKALRGEMNLDQFGFLGFDVSSGVESQRGVKDADKIRAFIKAARC